MNCNFAFAEIVCDTDIVKYVAVYEPNEYTCANGYFLPANTDGCRPCPNGFTCNGGTYKFNKDRYQGATLNNMYASTMNNMCGDNFAINMHAIYEPNTINVNFDDGNGNVTSMTCEYGDTITIPETVPTRPGYTFTGWVVRQSEQ